MNLTIDFPLILTGLVFLSGIIALVDFVWFAKKRKAAGKELPWIVEYARSFFPVLLAVWLIRSFIVQPYRVPTGSLEPTVTIGDFIAASQFSYGLRLPVIHTKILNIGEPKRGDIALFYWPINPKIIYIKRVIGAPGDKIQYKNKVLYINGKKMQQQYVGKAYDTEPNEDPVAVIKKTENLMGVEHNIYINPTQPNTDFSIIVPKGMYFMMGDNRDDSDDSRMWGFVPENDLIGRAFLVWFSWNSRADWFHKVRWERIGKSLG